MTFAEKVEDRSAVLAIVGMGRVGLPLGIVFAQAATHDPAMIDLAREWARDHQVAADRFEFQMLYGVRRDLQASLVAAGYQVRVYVPFGREWFPYFMRRLGERPANLMFVLRAVVGESAASRRAGL